MKFSFITSVLAFHILLSYLIPAKAQIASELSADQLEIVGSRLYLSFEEGHEFDLLAATLARTAEQEVRYRSLIDTGVRLNEEANELASKTLRSNDESLRLNELRSLQKINQDVIPHLISIIYSPDSFDVNAMVLPVDYKGVGFDALWYSLQDKFQEKSEFETTSSYTQRMQKAESIPIFGRFDMKSVFPTLVNPDSVSIKFDADRQMIQIGFIYPFIGDLDAEELIPMAQTMKSNGFYTGTNAYGAQAQVEKVDKFCRLLAYQGVRKFSGKRSKASPEKFMEFSMPTSIAVDAKKNLQVLAIYKLKKPYTGFTQRGFNATIANPTDSSVQNLFLFTDLMSLWVYNAKTGEVYKKLDAKV
ncbi:MAG TPA: HEAT repeat domain-containing protein [Abditibacterium sp.]|jgi:hypothetical protein